MPRSNPPEPADVRAFDADTLAVASSLLKAGELVALPTETVYGLAADASNPEAVARIYRAKGRPDFNPLIVHVPSLDAAKRLARFDDLAERLATHFWPGALTLVLALADGADVAKAVTAGPTIALRCPAHPVMRAVLEDSGLMLAAPSANPSGGISPSRAEHVAAGLGDRVPLIIDGGPCSEGIESTIIAVREQGWEILRPGPISADVIARLAGPALAAGERGIEAPGQLASHYAPSKPLRLDATDARAGEYLIGFGDIAGDENLSPAGDLAEAAARLYDALHRADASDADAIAVAAIPGAGIGAAINDRLGRAAVR